MSHPVRVRGLKPTCTYSSRSKKLSHPVRVRGLKHHPQHILDRLYPSHPVRVRGLKLGLHAQTQHQESRTPCGCVG